MTGLEYAWLKVGMDWRPIVIRKRGFSKKYPWRATVQGITDFSRESSCFTSHVEAMRWADSVIHDAKP